MLWHIWMSHVTYDRVTAHMEKLLYIWCLRMCYQCHIWMRQVIYEWVMSHMDDSRDICKIAIDLTFANAYQCHIWMSHVTYEWVMSHMNESCHIWMSHVTYEWCMSHMNDSGHMCKIAMNLMFENVCQCGWVTRATSGLFTSTAHV